MACLASNDACGFHDIFFFFSLLPCYDGMAGRYARPIRTDMRTGRTGCVQTEGGSGPPLRIKWQAAKQFTISKKSIPSPPIIQLTHFNH